MRKVVQITACFSLFLSAGYLEERATANMQGTAGGSSQEAREQARCCESEIKSSRIESETAEINKQETGSQIVLPRSAPAGCASRSLDREQFTCAFHSRRITNITLTSHLTLQPHGVR